MNIIMKRAKSFFLQYCLRAILFVSIFYFLSRLVLIQELGIAEVLLKSLRMAVVITALGLGTSGLVGGMYYFAEKNRK